MPGLTLTTLVLVGVGAPASLLALLGAASLFNRPLTERWTGTIAGIAMTVSCAALLLALAVYGAQEHGAQLISFGAWSASNQDGITIEFLVDSRSLGFAALSTAIAGVVSAFSSRYLHREPGYSRYFILLALFVTGMLLLALAGNVSVLFVGWEFVGLSSALLVAFFQERPASVGNAFRVLSVYRISDAAMLSAAVLLRHLAGSDSLSLLFGSAPLATAGLSGSGATLIAILLIVAVAGKSALLPFSGWLPRAMEGPTPSSAVYYGALSIHAGCFLLLRAAPLIEQAPGARWLVGGLGATTAIFAAIATRVQSDVKSSLAYASLTQVGLIIVEIAIGWYTIAFVHIAGHASFRLLQFLSAPNVLHDLHAISDALGGHAPAAHSSEGVAAERLRGRLFLFAIERGFLDSLIERIITDPFMRGARALSRLDQRLCDAVLPQAEMRSPARGNRDE